MNQRKRKNYRVEGSTYYDGINDYSINNNVFYGTTAFQILNTQKFTLSVWVKVPSFPSTLTATVLSKYNWINSINDKGYYLEIDKFGRVIFQMKETFVDWLGGVTQLNNLTVNKWHHICVTHNGVNTRAGYDLKIYLNGNNHAFPFDTGNATQGSIAVTNNFLMGAREIGPSQGQLGRYFEGNMCQLSFWPVVEMTDAQVKELYNGGHPIDLSKHSAYSQVLFSSNLNKYHALGIDNDIYASRFSAFGVDWCKGRLGWTIEGGFLTAALSNYSIQHVGNIDSKEYPYQRNHETVPSVP